MSLNCLMARIKKTFTQRLCFPYLWCAGKRLDVLSLHGIRSVLCLLRNCLTQISESGLRA